MPREKVKKGSKKYFLLETTKNVVFLIVDNCSYVNDDYLD